MNVGINQKVAPIKFCFLTRPNSKKSFENAVSISCALWGGFYSPIIPLYKKLPTSYRNELGIELSTQEYYYNTFDNYNVDVIIYDDSLDEEMVNEVSNERRILPINKFKNELLSGFSLFGIDIFQLLHTLIDEEFKYVRNDSVKISLPTFNKNDLLLKTRIGFLDEEIQNEIVDNLSEAVFFENPKFNLKSKITEDRLNYFGLYSISTYKLNIGREKHWYNESAFYFIKKEKITDVHNFWNLRALGWNIIPIPIDKLNHDHYNDIADDIINWYTRGKENLSFTHLNILMGAGIDKKDIIQIDDFLKTRESKSKSKILFAKHNWAPRYWESPLTLDADKAVSCYLYTSQSYDQHETNDDYVRFKADGLPFKIEKEGYRDNFYKVEIEMSLFDDSFLKAGAISEITTSDWNQIVRTFDRSKWHLSSKSVAYYIRSGDDRIQFQIPSAKDFYKLYFKNKGKKLVINSNGKLAEEVIKNLGGIRGAYFLGRIETLELITLFENGKVIEHHALTGEIKRRFKNNDNSNVEFLIRTLIEDKIIELGANLKCSICHQMSFFLPKELDNVLNCRVCRNSFEIPSSNPNEIKWAFRGIGPFSRNNKVGGLMTVFLCLRLFKNEFAHTFGAMSTLAGFELEESGKPKQEIDLAALINRSNNNDHGSELLLCECKTFKNFIQEDFDRMKLLGNDIPGSTLVFATLNESFTNYEKEELRRLVTHFRKGDAHRPLNSVLLLTRNELMPSEIYDALKEYDADIKSFHRYQGFISHLSEMTVQKHLGMKTWGEIFEEKWKKLHQKKL